MKSLAMPALYVFSIALAVGIGMYQIGGTEVDRFVGKASECKQGVDKGNCATVHCGRWSSCKTVTAGTGADSCSQTSSACYDANGDAECRTTESGNNATLTYSDCDAG